MSQSVPPGAVRTYHSTVMRLLGIFVGLICMLYGIFLVRFAGQLVSSRHVASIIITVALGVVIFVGGVLIIWSGFRIRITTSPEEIVFCDGVYTVRTPWSNVEKIADLKASLFGPPRTFLVLREPLFTRTVRWRAIGGREAAKFRGRLVPLTGVWVNQTQLLADIRRYAPQTNEA